jgi:hypothetical protein
MLLVWPAPMYMLQGPVWRRIVRTAPSDQCCLHRQESDNLEARLTEQPRSELAERQS